MFISLVVKVQTKESSAWVGHRGGMPCLCLALSHWLCLDDLHLAKETWYELVRYDLVSCNHLLITSINEPARRPAIVIIDRRLC
jgi:hypothetical protein